MASSIIANGAPLAPAALQTPTTSAEQAGASRASGASVATTPAAPGPAAAAVTVTLSSNAQRLQTAEANLATDEASSSTGALAAEWNRDILDSVSSLNEAPADAEVAALPSSDPDHIAQAQAAQSYVKTRVNSAGTVNSGGPYGPNPFAGLSQSALSAIINDKSGLYTNYEKSAALYESTDQTNSWVLQYQNAPQGQNAGFYEEAQKQYHLLSPLQQSIYPEDYIKQLKYFENLQSNAPGKSESAAQTTPAATQATAAKHGHHKAQGHHKAKVTQPDATPSNQPAADSVSGNADATSEAAATSASANASPTASIFQLSLLTPGAAVNLVA
jgi:hypothetical protein